MYLVLFMVKSVKHLWILAKLGKTNVDGGKNKEGTRAEAPLLRSLSDADHIDADDDLLQAAQIFVYRGIT